MDRRAESYRSREEGGKPPFDYSLLNPHLKHLPPRSKTGCWTCRKRKVKCGEERPICAQCVRLGQHCDYEVKYSFKDANKTLVGKKGDLNGNPAWDPTTRRPRPSASSDLDDTPDFTTLSTEEDRERKAAFHEPGKFYVVANQDSFSSLPEYNQASTRRSSSTLGASSGRVSRSTRHSQGESDVSPGGDDTVILTRFEMPTDRPTEKKNLTPPLAASRTRTSPTEQRPHHLPVPPLPPPIPQYSQSSSSSASYQDQPFRRTYQPTPLDTSSLQYYTNPPSSSSSAYTPQSQQPSPPFPRLPQYPPQIPTQYPSSSYQYAPIVPQDSQQYASFSRLLPQPTLPVPNSMQQHHHSQQLSTLQPSPLSQQTPFSQTPFTSSTSYTHHTTPSMYHYATTSPTNYAQSLSPTAYSSSSVTPSYTAGALSYTQTSGGATSYDQTQSQTLYGQAYTVPQAVETTVSPQEAPSRMYSYGWGQGHEQAQGESQGQGVQQGRQSSQEQGYIRY